MTTTKSAPIFASEAHVAIFLAEIAEPGDGLLGRVLSGYEQSIRGMQQFAVDLSNGRLRVAPDEQREAIDGLARWTPRIPQQADLNRAVERLITHGIGIVLPWHGHWPARLEKLGEHAPRVLFFRGNVNLLSRKSTAVVGARAATSYGEHVANTITAELVERGRVVISGAAYGIDGMAHRAALANGSETIAVLAGGVDRFYPAGHESLLQRIATEGLVVSEAAPGWAPTKWRFLQRNRIIAALAEQVVVIEAGIRSGSLNTASHAAALDIPVYAIPGPITSAASAGCHSLIHQGVARIATSAAEILYPEPA